MTSLGRCKRVTVTAFLLLILLCDAASKMFEPRSKKISRLQAELHKLEAERLSKVVVVAGSATCVMLIALVVQLGRSRRRWKRIALQTQTAQHHDTSGPPRPLRAVTPRYTVLLVASSAVFLYVITFNLGQAFERSNRTIEGGAEEKIIYSCLTLLFTLLVLLVLTFGLQSQTRDTARDTGTCSDDIGKVSKQHNEPSPVAKLDVVVVGVGPRVRCGWGICVPLCLLLTLEFEFRPLGTFI